MQRKKSHSFYPVRWRQGARWPYFAALYFLTFSVFFVPLGALFARICSGEFSAGFLRSLLFECRSVVSGQPLGLASFLPTCFLCFTFLLLCMLLGLSIWGFAALPVTCALRGSLFGLSFGLLYWQNAAEGFLLNLLVCAPRALCEFAVLSIAACDAFLFSRRLSGPEQEERTKNLERYCLRFSVYLAAGACICAMQCLLLFLFQGYFKTN